MLVQLTKAVAECLLRDLHGCALFDWEEPLDAGLGHDRAGHALYQEKIARGTDGPYSKSVRATTHERQPVPAGVRHGEGMKDGHAAVGPTPGPITTHQQADPEAAVPPGSGRFNRSS